MGYQPEMKCCIMKLFPSAGLITPRLMKAPLPEMVRGFLIFYPWSQPISLHFTMRNVTPPQVPAPVTHRTGDLSGSSQRFQTVNRESKRLSKSGRMLILSGISLPSIWSTPCVRAKETRNFEYPAAIFATRLTLRCFSSL
jgi:hypothetical protein